MILVPAEKIANYVREGYWGEQTLGALFLSIAERQPTAFAVADAPNRPSICGSAPQQWGWAELRDHVGRVCAFFASEGLRKDDVIVLQMPNCVEMHAIYLASAICGIIISPVPVQYRSHELQHVCHTTGAVIALTVQRVGHHQVAADWAAHRFYGADVRAVWALGDSAAPAMPEGIANLEAALAGYAPWTAAQMRAHMEAIDLTAHDVFTICWTSGTEARPKGVPRNHNEWLIVGESVLDAGQLKVGCQMVIPFPFVNMAGISTSLIAWLLTSGGVHHHHPFDVDVFIEQLRTNPTDYTVAAPAVLSMLLKAPEKLDGVDLGRLRRVGSGGGPLAGWMVAEFASRFGIEVVNYFGSNEGAALSSTPQDIPDQEHRARYFPRFGVPGFTWSLRNAQRVQTRLVNPDTEHEITSPGEVGELRFKGPTIFSGYFRAPELTAKAFDALGYYRTGDLFEIAGDRQQFYRFAGRHKDIVIRGGMNISCEEVENLLLGHPRVREVAVIGYPDPALGERVCAVVVPQPTAHVALDELVAFLRDQEEVAAFKWPEKLLVVDTLPRNPMGKVLKRELRQRWAPDEAPK